MNKVFRWVFLLLISSSYPAQAAEIAGLFSQLPIVKQASVSPDGRHMVGVFHLEEKVFVMTSPFGSRETTAVVSLRHPSDRIESVHWANNERLLVTTSIAKVVNGSAFRQTVIYAVNIDGSKNVIIKNKSPYKQDESPWIKQFTSVSIVNTLVDDDEHIIVRAYDERDSNYALFKVNIYTSSFEKVENGTDNRYGFVTNRSGQAVFSLTQGKHDDFITVYYKKPGTADWVAIKKLKITGDVKFDPVAIDGDNLYVITDLNADHSYVSRFNTATGELSSPVLQESGYDITDVLLDTNEQLVGYISNRDFSKHVYVAEQQKMRADKIDAALKGRENYLVSLSQDLSKVLIYSVTANSPARYYTFDFSTNKAGFWLSQYPHLEKKAMSIPQPIQFKARDGYQLSGYLTLPAGDKKAPLIVHPHGGPHSRDYQEFDPWVQFLSQMGYAVLQVNFRGSAGLGNRHEVAGYRQWGRLMQDDVMDGFAFAATVPRVDASRSCVVGASYGGYVALVAAYRDPGHFKCFISISGVTDLVSMLRLDVSGYAPRRLLYATRIGDYESDAQMLNQVSPLQNVAKITKPVLLLHGLKDTQVHYSQSTKLYEQMRAKDLPVRYVELEAGTHYFDEAEDRKLLFAEMESFLKQHLPL